MNFSKLADIHERLRLGSKPGAELKRIESLEEALFAYELFFPSHARISPTSVAKMIGEELGLYINVVKEMLPDEEVFMGLASESNKTSSRNLTTGQVLSYPYEAASFTDIAYRHDEKEARLVWRWLLKARAVLSKRTFFAALARQLKLPVEVVLGSQSKDTLIKMYKTPSSIMSLKEWWKYEANFPTPARWKAWSKLQPPEGQWYAIVIPSMYPSEESRQRLWYTWGNVTYNREGVPIGSTREDFNILKEFTHNTVLDYISSADPHAPFSRRMRHIRARVHDLSKHGAWELVNNRVQHEDVHCVRLIHEDTQYEPGGVMGYTLHAERSRAYLKLEKQYTEKKELRWELAALDGLSDFVPVVDVPSCDEAVVKEDTDLGEVVIVVEVAVLSADANGNITQCLPIRVRRDLGINDLTQITELIERGMTHAEN